MESLFFSPVFRARGGMRANFILVFFNFQCKLEVQPLFFGVCLAVQVKYRTTHLCVKIAHSFQPSLKISR